MPTARKTDKTPHARRRRRLASEHAVWRVLALSDDVDSAAKGILEAVCQFGEWDIGELWMLDDVAGELRLNSYWHQSNSDLSEFIEISQTIAFKWGIGLPGRVWASASPKWVEDVVMDPNFPRARIADRAGLHAAFGFPIKIRDAVVGVMAFYSPEFREPDVDLLESMDLIGGQIGHFMARVRAQNTLAASEARWHRIWTSAPLGIFHSLPGGKMLDVNPAFAAILGYESPEQLIDMVNRSSIREVLYLNPEKREEILDSIMKSPGKWIGAETEGRRPDGRIVTALLQVKLLDQYKGQKNVIEGFLIDMTERKKMEVDLQAALDKVRELTLRDHLTGLHNRRHLEERLEIEIAAAQRNRDDVSLIMFDIDHFKDVNDTYGHSIGDAVLQILASTLGMDVRPGDVLARYGGEEFVLLMRQTGIAQAVEVAERLRVMVERTIFDTAEGALRVTISCGVASVSECGQGSRMGLVNMADERMYRAKALGRNRVVGPDSLNT